jgi:hypothetical protein
LHSNAQALGFGANSVRSRVLPTDQTAKQA